MNTVQTCLSWAQAALASSGNENANKEARLLLAFTLQCELSSLYAWPAKVVTLSEQKIFENYVKRRREQEPIAYITGVKEFCSLSFKVTPMTLIPRPETEQLVEIVLAQLPKQHCAVVDLGTGCGVIACTLAKARPLWDIFATDRHAPTLAIAKENAQSLGVSHIHFVQGHWLAAFKGEPFDAIVSNPPYIKKDDPHLPALSYEPQAALIGGSQGTETFEAILANVKNCLKPEGFLAFEHGFDQADFIQTLLKKSGFTQIQTHHDLANLPRITSGVYKI